MISHKYIVSVFVFANLLILSSCSKMQQKPVPLHSATIPAPSSLSKAAMAGWTRGGTWMNQHEDINAIGRKRRVDLVFLGDSITQSWGGEGRNVWKPAQSTWDKYYADRNAANFGISGDRTQHILWRIENGNFDSINPKVIVLMAGTNNINDNSAEEISDGIKAVVRELQARCPQSRILLLGVFPRGQNADNPLRAKITQINQRIEKLNDGKEIFYLDIGNRFLNPDGSANTVLMRQDFIHLNQPGYEIWARAIEPTLKKLMD